MVITAKFASVCPSCNNRIAVGSKVEWTKGEKAKHVSCPQTSSAPVAKTERQPRLPDLVGEKGPYGVAFEGSKHSRDNGIPLGTLVWTRMGAAKVPVAMVVVGYAPARWLSEEHAEDMGHYGMRSGYHGTEYRRAATLLEYATLMGKDPREGGACLDVVRAIAAALQQVAA